jgi:Mor family transcriptional regulator
MACSTPDQAARYLLCLLYLDSATFSTPRTDKTPPKLSRNAEIRARYEAGETIAELARAFGISIERIHQILHRRRK